jgi:hypothetical protein
MLRYPYIASLAFGQKSSEWDVAEERTYIYPFTESKTIIREASIRLEN